MRAGLNRPHLQLYEGAFDRLLVVLYGCLRPLRRVGSRREGWRVNHKGVERLWRREGLKVPRRQPKRGRLWLASGSCVRRRAEHRDHVWSYDFVFDRTHDGKPLRMLTIVDEYIRECLAIDVERGLRSRGQQVGGAQDLGDGGAQTRGMVGDGQE